MTRLTCESCSSAAIEEWIMPMPPLRAMAIAILYSVTVSISEEMMGSVSFTLSESSVSNFVCRGKMAEYCVASVTSS